MLQEVKRITAQNRVLVSSLVFYGLSGLTSVVNYIFYPIIARLVSVSSYGEIQFLITMFAQLSVGFVVLNILAVVIGVSVKDKTVQHSTIQALNTISQAVAIVVATFGVGILISNKQSLSLGAFSSIFLGIGLVANVPFTIAVGRLQSSERFVASGVVSLFSVVVKLFTAIVVAKLGLGTPGVVASVAFGLIAAWILGEILLGTHAGITFRFTPIPIRQHLQKLSFLRSQALVAIIAVTALTVLSSVDSIVSRLTLSHYDAGLYAAVATIAKTILALATPIMWLALPPAVAGKIHTIRKYILLTTLTCLAAGIMIVLFPPFFTTVLIGINPGRFLNLMTIATISMTIYAIAFLVTTVNICLRYMSLVTISILLAVLTYAGTYFSMSFTYPLQASLYAQALAGMVILMFNLSPFLIKSRNTQRT